MRTNLRYFFIFAVSMLACSVSTSAENALSVNKDTHINSKASTDVNTVEMTVIAYQLNVRDDANGKVVEGFYYIQGDNVVIYDELTIGDINWCRVTPLINAPRWVACDWLKGAE